MRKILLLIALTVITFTVSCSDNTGLITDITNSSESDVISLKHIKEKIVAAEEKVNKLFSNEIDGTVISYIHDKEGRHTDIEVVKYIGSNNTFSDVCAQLKDYCTPNVAEILIRKVGFINVDGNIGFIAATGEVAFSEFDVSDMKIVSFENDKAVVSVTRHTTDFEFSKNFLYTLQIGENGNFIITDLKEMQ